MSRSFKKQPFMAVTGNGSAKHDKMLAHRGERRAHKRAIHKAFKEQDFESFLLPARHECHWNDTYDWGRDGHQRYQGLDARDWARYIEATEFTRDYPALDRYYRKYYAVWPPAWFTEMMRK